MDFRDIVQFLDLVKDPKKYQTIADEFSRREEALAKLSTNMGELSQATQLKEAAQLALDKARKDAAEILAKAEGQAKAQQSKLEEAVAEAARTMSLGNDKLHQATEKLQQAESLTKEARLEVGTKEKVLDKLEKDLRAREADLVTREQVLATKLEKLKGIL